MHQLYFLVFFYTSLTTAFYERGSSGTCVDISIPLYVEAENLDLSVLPGFLEDPASFLASTTAATIISNAIFNRVPVSGNEVIAATYCEPSTTSAGRKDTLQLLAHGITYTRDYWRATPQHYQPSNYSWVDYALAEGYPILAFDRLGCGLSSHPDPFTQLQVPYETRATHALIEQIRNGTTGELPRAFSKVIYVGHSFGSVIGNNLVNEFPHDVDAIILTGFSQSVALGATAALGTALVPASIFSPSRFGNLLPGYLIMSRKAGRQYAFYYQGFYDPVIFEIDWATESIVGAAEIVTTQTGITSAREFDRPVYVLTGNRDVLFCAPLVPGQAGNCGSGPTSRLVQTGQLFPAAQPYSYNAVPDTGHNVNYHFTAQTAFRAAHRFLSDRGF